MPERLEDEMLVVEGGALCTFTFSNSSRRVFV